MAFNDAALPVEETVPCGSHLRVHVTELARATVVRVHGAVDPGNAHLLHDAVHMVLEGRPEGLLIDVSGMSTGSVRALSVLVETADAAAAAGIPYATVALAPLHARLLQRLWPSHEHVTHPTLADALAAIMIAGSGAADTAQRQVPHRNLPLGGVRQPTGAAFPPA